MPRPIAFADYRAAARRRLPRFLFDYIDGGSFDEVTLTQNEVSLRGVSLRQRTLIDVSRIDLSSQCLGMAMTMPVLLAPVGLAGMTAPRGEAQAAKAASHAGVPFCLSTVSICSLEEVAAASERPFIFQLYMTRDRDVAASLLERATRLGCSVLMLTVDLPLPGFRYRDYRSGMSSMPSMGRTWARARDILTRPGWAIDLALAGRPHSFGNVTPYLGEHTHIEDFPKLMQVSSDPSMNWADLDWIRRHWSGPIVLKGILDPEDARRAADSGVDGIVVSNHGGRQLDGVVATVERLPVIADAVGERLTVLADGGVRSGLDVLRMLALGAKGVMFGRAWAYALASGGGAGVHGWLRQIGAELTHAMALAGCRNIAEVGPHILDRPDIALM